ncbi:hypothetical protein F442_20738 [Phytophthora nicotianae P10297]|uniref:Uncharacterized protein n=1 Tax=Phytophthora nicotianae P10297 TaxID=1317064 RepID=W2Y7Q2_PHYNI|nr:hypothetical protein F442_20738 [Phytophthora nicotianae P10297]
MTSTWKVSSPRTKVIVRCRLARRRSPTTTIVLLASSRIRPRFRWSTRLARATATGWRFMSQTGRSTKQCVPITDNGSEGEASNSEQTESTEAPSATSNTPAPDTATPEPQASTDAPETTPSVPEATPATPTEAATPSGKCGLRRRS